MGDRRQADRELAERVLSGRLDPADAPPELAPVTEMVRRASEVPAAIEVDDALVTAMASAVADSPTRHTTTRRSRRPMIAELLTAKVAAIAATAVLGATTAAAATGTLPEPVQDTVADVAEHVGVDLPDSASDRAKEVHEILRTTPPGPERGKALSQKPDTDDSTTAENETEPEGKVTGQDRAAEAKANAATRKAAGQQRAADAKANAGAETDDERETPPVSTPNQGGTGTADDASGGASSTGTAKAAEKSGGASTAGSANADAAEGDEQE